MSDPMTRAGTSRAGISLDAGGGGPRRVAVNLLWCEPGRVGGSEEYLARQLVGLDVVDPGHQSWLPTVFAPAAYPTAHPEIAERYEIRRPPLGAGGRPTRILTEHLWLPRQAAGMTLVHHGGGTAAPTRGVPVVLTVHDLQYLTYPEYFSRARLSYLRWSMPRSVAQAAIVTTPSEYVRQRVVEAFSISPDRVMVVPHGIDQASINQAGIDQPGSVGMDGVLTVLQGRRYVVYPAITHPHKNHRVLLEAIARDRSDRLLVLLGGHGAADAEVMSAMTQLGVAERIVRPGRVPDAVRDAVIASAEALVFPSRYEGFGAPVIEAMALGTPVVTSTHPALLEVGGDAAIAVDPDDPAAWLSALDQVEARRDEMITAGRVRVGRFSLEVSGRALIGAYEAAVAR